MNQTYEVAVPEYPKKISGLICEEIEGSNEYVYIHEDNGAALTLNATASAVFDMCDGETSAKDMAAMVSDSLGVDYHIAMRDIVDILEELSGFGFLQG